MKSSNITYVNKEISSQEEDFIGFSAQVDSIAEAIDNGASMVGVIADYGSGKSSIGELLASKKQFQKPIRVNMWDSLNRVKGDPIIDDSLIALDKSLLYQIAYNSGKKGLAKHVNKRLNKSNGFISFTLKSWTFWIFFAIAVVFTVTGILIQSSNFSFNIFEYTINNGIFLLLYLAAAITILLGLRNSSVAFSSWKSEGDKKFDSSDIFSIYSEIIENISGSKKCIVIIEDLDRLGKKEVELISNFIKEIYRFSNLSKNYNISFVVSIKPAAQLGKENNKDFILDYDKVFDYIVDLKPIHIDDFRVILNSLLNEKQSEIEQLIEVNGNQLYSEFAILIGGTNLTIRKLKHRLNNALVLYRSLKEKQIINSKTSINMRTCCVVAYLQSQYETCYDQLIREEAIFNNIIKKAYSLRLLESANENKIQELKNYIKNQKQNKQSGKPFFEEEFCDEMSVFLINGLIGDDFRQYFYSYPKGCYIKIIEESELENLILFPTKEISNDDLSYIVNKSLARGGKVVDDAINMLIDRKIILPSLILNNEQLLAYCFNKFPHDVILMMQRNLLWDKNNSERTINTLTKINAYNIDKKEELFKMYSNEITSYAEALGSNGLDCRLGVVKNFKENILLFSDIFLAEGSPCLTDEEVKIIESENTLFALIDDKKFSLELIVALSEKFEKPLLRNNYDKLICLISNYVKANPVNVDIAKSIIKILSINRSCNNMLFSYISNCKEIRLEIISYLNLVAKQIDNEYCKIIEKQKLIGNFDREIITALYTNECYLTYLTNAVFNDCLNDKSYNIEVITPQIVNLLYGTNVELFNKYRLKLLQQTTEIKKTYKFMFASPYPLLTEEERNTFTCDDCINLIDTTVLFKNIDDFQCVFNCVIKTKEDIYKFSKYILGIDDNRALDVFEQMPFEQCQFNMLVLSGQNELLDLYEHFEKLTSVTSIIEYMDITRTLNESLEKRLLNLFNETTPTYDLWDSYIKLLNELDEYTETTLLILKQYKFENALPPQITNKFYERKEYIGYIVGKTLFNEKFDYENIIPLNFYLEIYTTVPNVAKFMQDSKDFIEQIYLAKNYENLNKEQLLIYTGWDLNFELFKAAMEKLENDIERKEFIIKSNKISTVEDNDLIADYVCQNKFLNMLADEELKAKIMYLLWDDHYWKKGKLTKFLNKHKKVA